jgi:hypothetical protein
MLSAAALTCTIVVVFLILAMTDDDAGTSSTFSAAGDRAPSNVDELRDFEGYPVFWAGETVAGHSFDRVYAPSDDEFGASPTLIVYGQCGDAFLFGCEPAAVVKTIPVCSKYAGEITRLRERRAWRAPVLTIETGNGTVEIHATADLEDELVAQLETLNDAEFAPSSTTQGGTHLPGSVCEYLAANPRPTRPIPTASTQEPYTPDPVAATVISSFGDLTIILDRQQAVETLGWAALESIDPRYTLTGGDFGSIRAYGERSAFLDQSYWFAGKETAIHVTQEPASNRDFVPEFRRERTFGRWSGTFWQQGEQVGFKFYSGEMAGPDRIRVSVYAKRGEYRMEDIEQFVASLRFFEEAMAQ